MVELAAVVADVLQAGKLSVLAKEWHYQPTVAGHARAVHADALAGEVGVIWVSRLRLLPDGLDGGGCHLVLALKFRVSDRLGLCDALCVGHFLAGGQLAANVRAPG